jgi:hypothetical protein
MFWAKLKVRRYVNIYSNWIKKTVGLNFVTVVSSIRNHCVWKETYCWTQFGIGTKVLIRSRVSIVLEVELNNAMGRHMWLYTSHKGFLVEGGGKSPGLVWINSHSPSHCPASDRRVHAVFLWLWDLHIAAWGHLTWPLLCCPTSDTFHRTATQQKVTI